VDVTITGSFYTSRFPSFVWQTFDAGPFAPLAVQCRRAILFAEPAASLAAIIAIAVREGD